MNQSNYSQQNQYPQYDNSSYPQYDNSSYHQYNPAYDQEDDSLIKAQIEVEEALHKFEMEVLRGMKEVIDIKNKKREWKPIAPGKQKLCNELGIREILGRLRGRVTVTGKLTFKTDEEVMKDMFYFHMSLLDLFTKRADDWDMEEEMVKPILDSCIELVQDVVFAARRGFTATNMRSQYTRSEVQSTQSQGEQGGKSFLGLRRK